MEFFLICAYLFSDRGVCRYMNGEEYKQQFGLLRLNEEMLRQDRDESIKARYRELYNINTWHQIKAGYVYMRIAKEYGISTVSVRRIIAQK